MPLPVEWSRDRTYLQRHLLLYTTFGIWGVKGVKEVIARTLA